MTEREAQRMLNEIRTIRPSFVRGRHRYTVRRDGRVEIERAIGKSGLRWSYEMTVAADWCALPADIRERAQEAA